MQAREEVLLTGGITAGHTILSVRYPFSPFAITHCPTKGGFTMWFLCPNYDECLDKSANAFVFVQSPHSVHRKLLK